MPKEAEKFTRGAKQRRGGPVFSDRGIVLRSYKLGESDKIIRILTREHGKRSAVAKGVRRTKSRFGARLEPFSCVKLLIHQGRSMDIIKQAEIDDSFNALREDLSRFACASVMAEIADVVAQEHEPNPELFDLLLEGMRMLLEYPEHEAFILSFFEFRALADAGFELRVTECARCGGSAEGEQSFSLRLGGIICDRCSSDSRGEAGKLIRLSAGAIRALRWMAGHTPVEVPESELFLKQEREICLLLDRVLEHMLEREFRAFKVMRRIPGTPESKTEGGLSND